MKHLDRSLNVPPQFETRQAIIEHFWPATALPTYLLDNLDWEPYFRFYVRQCQAALVGGGQSVSAKTHQDILDLIRSFENDDSRESIKERLRTKLAVPSSFDEDEILDGAIDLAARLCLMVNVAVDARTVSGSTRLNWASGNLKQSLRNYFEEPQILSDAGLRLEPMFTVANMESISGFRIVPTDNLADHLRLLDRDDTVAVFCNISFLKRHASTVLPPGLVAETLQTLALLLPINDRGTEKWLRRNSRSQGLDKALYACGPLRLDDRQFAKFAFWHDRLVILKQAFDQSRPSTISQWWHDRRNGVQWYTFWVAIIVLILTVFFGLVQSIEGALQVYKAFHPT